MSNKFGIDHNMIKWSGFFKDIDDAQKHLDEKVAIYNKTRLIVSAKKELFENSKTHEKLLFRFTIATAPKND
jgi:hypothetical protein